MTTILSEIQCWSCRHYVSGLESPNRVESCAAFPDGIPRAILANTADHRQPYPGDHGVRWESNGEPHPRA